MMFEHAYVDAGDRQIHALMGGHGPAVLFIAAPRLDLRATECLLQELRGGAAVLAVDLPGHGWTDSAPPGHDVLTCAVDDLERTLNLLGVRRCPVVAMEGARTLARLLAARGRVQWIAVIDPPLVDTTGTLALECYAPDAAGSHLTRAWNDARERALFRPVQMQTRATRRRRAMDSAEALTRTAVALLRSGRPGAELERACVGHRVPPLVEERDGVPGELAELLATSPAEDTVTFARAPGAGTSTKGFRRAWVRTPRGWLHARLSSRGSARPVVGLHDPAGTSALVTPFLAPLGATRPVIALDLPGNGGSEDVVRETCPESRRFAEVVSEALDLLGVDEFDVVGRYSGGPIGMELSFLHPGRVRHLVQAGITTYERDEAERLLARYTPSMAPVEHGGHLSLAWHMMKSQALFWPWFDQTESGIIDGEPQLEPRLIHQRVMDLLTCGDLYRRAYAALWTYPLRDRLPAVSAPTLLCAPPWDPLFEHLSRAASAGPQCEVATRPAAFERWSDVIGPFLDRERSPSPSQAAR